MSEVCSCPRCTGPAWITYFGKPICPLCWKKHCDEKINLKEVLKIKEPINMEVSK